MSKIPGPRILLITTLLVVLAPAASASIERTFDVDPGGKLTVDAENAAVQVVGSDDDEVRIDISRNGDDADEILEDFDIRFDQQDDEVTLIVEIRENVRRTRSLDIQVALPDRFDIDLGTSGGRINVDGVTGTMAARTSGGGLRFENVDGTILGRTSGGSIYLEGTSGDVDFKTSGGHITIGSVDGGVLAHTSGGDIAIEHAGGRVDASTSGGGIELKDVTGAIDAKTSGGKIYAGISSQPESATRLSTSGGSITVGLKPGLAFTLKARTSGGSVSSDLPVTFTGSTAKGRLEGDINGGGPELTLKASGGSIHLQAL